jgi:hypothetical protein
MDDDKSLTMALLDLNQATPLGVPLHIPAAEAAKSLAGIGDSGLQVHISRDGGKVLVGYFVSSGKPGSPQYAAPAAILSISDQPKVLQEFTMASKSWYIINRDPVVMWESAPHAVSIWSLSSQPLVVDSLPYNPGDHLLPTSDLKYVIVWGDASGLELWNLETRQKTFSFVPPSPVAGVRFTLEEKAVAIAFENKATRILDLEKARMLPALPEPGPSLNLGHPGEAVFSYNRECQQVIVWNTRGMVRQYREIYSLLGLRIPARFCH